MKRIIQTYEPNHPGVQKKCQDSQAKYLNSLSQTLTKMLERLNAREEEMVMLSGLRQELDQEHTQTKEFAAAMFNFINENKNLWEKNVANVE